MAFIPDEAVDRLCDLSKGARHLYVFLARCRNQKTGRCFPSVMTTQQSLNINRASVYALRRELIEKGWATFNGDDVTSLFAFASPNNQTVGVDSIRVTESPEIQTGQSRNLDSKVQKLGLNSPESWTAYKEEPAKEPANRTSKDIHVSSPVLEVFTYWQAAMNHPQAKLTPKRKKLIKARLDQGYTVAQIQTAIDGCRASPFHMGQNDSGTVFDDLTLICRNGDKLEFFISRSNSSGKPRISHKETHNERAARETAELIAEAFAPASGDSGSDPADPGAQGIAVDFRRI